MHRFGRAVRGRRRPPDRTREHRHDRPLVRPVPSRNGPPGRGRRGPHPPRRCRRPAGQDLLRRYAAAHRPRREPHRPPPGAVPRRTHRRRRPDQPPRLWHLVRDLAAEGTTVLLTTQYLDEADQLADRIAVIDHGRLLTEGTATELKDR